MSGNVGGGNVGGNVGGSGGGGSVGGNVGGGSVGGGSLDDREQRKVLVLNGPNLGRLGSREPDVYGSVSYAGLVRACEAVGAELGFEVEVRETNDEGDIVRWLHEAADGRIPVVINPGAFTHYSYAMSDAAKQRTAPLIEVHISNPHAREEFRHKSVIAPVASGTIAGFGINSYLLALRALSELPE